RGELRRIRITRSRASIRVFTSAAELLISLRTRKLSQTGPDLRPWRQAPKPQRHPLEHGQSTAPAHERSLRPTRRTRVGGRFPVRKSLVGRLPDLARPVGPAASVIVSAGPGAVKPIPGPRQVALDTPRPRPLHSGALASAPRRERPC